MWQGQVDEPKIHVRSLHLGLDYEEDRAGGEKTNPDFQSAKALCGCIRSKGAGEAKHTNRAEEWTTYSCCPSAVLEKNTKQLDCLTIPTSISRRHVEVRHGWDVAQALGAFVWPSYSDTLKGLI